MTIKLWDPLEVVSTIDYQSSKVIKKAIMTEPGFRIGRLVVQRRNAIGDVVCACDCGETISVRPNTLISGCAFECGSCSSWRSKSPSRQLVGEAAYQSLMRRYYSAKNRCEDKKHRNYNNYGGRGISFEFSCLDEYLTYLAPHVICRGIDGDVDRIDNDQGYKVGNLRICSKKQNSRNRRVAVLIDGIPLCDVIEGMGYDAGSKPTQMDNIRHHIRNHPGKYSTNNEEFRNLVKYNMERDVSSGERSPQQKIMLGGVPLKAALISMGHGEINKYNNVRSLIRSSNKKRQSLSLDDVRHYLDRYDERRARRQAKTHTYA